MSESDLEGRNLTQNLKFQRRYMFLLIRIYGEGNVSASFKTLGDNEKSSINISVLRLTTASFNVFLFFSSTPGFVGTGFVGTGFEGRKIPGGEAFLSSA